MKATFDPLLYTLRELRDRAAFVYEDVCAIAHHFHWSEAEILALPDGATIPLRRAGQPTGRAGKNLRLVASYLQGIARRATGEGLATVRPRRLMYAPPPAPADPPAESENIGVAPPPVAAAGERLAAPLVAPLPASRAPDNISPKTAPSPASATPARPGGPDESRTQEAVEDVVRPSAERPSTEPPAVAAAPRGDPATAPTGSRRSMARARTTPPPPDPLAIALAAAIRWTSSSDVSEPIAAAPDRPERRAMETAHQHAPAERLSSGPAASAARPTPLGTLPPVPLEPPAPRAHVDAGARPAPAPARRFTGIHIASVEVRVQPAPVPAPSPALPAPVPTNAQPATPLARGLTSLIGLRQS